MQTLKQFWQRYRVPIMLFALVSVCLIAFRHTLRPFLVALFIAYLIDPVVGWVNERSVLGRRIPRGLAVLSVYAVVLLVVGLFSALVIPQLIQEVGGLARDIPQTIQDVRHEKLPEINARLTRLVSRAPSAEEALPEIERAQEHVHEALAQSIEFSFLAASLPNPAERLRLQQREIYVESKDAKDVYDEELIRLRKEESGDWLVLLEKEHIEFQPQPDGSYRIQAHDPDTGPTTNRGAIDLGKMVDDGLDNIAQTAGQKFSDAFVFGQRLLSKVSSLLFATLITFMVAAFVSIDVPRILRFFRSMFPEDRQQSLGELLQDINRGLSGVIRGQLLICLVNGVLTGIGLFIFQVKFALVLAVFAGVMSLIPVFGTIISSVPCVLIALTHGPSTALGVAAWIAGIHFLEGNFLNPKIIGGSASIHPAIVVFALVAGEHVYGILGALLAVPIASLIQSLFLFFARDRWKEQAAQRRTQPTKSIS